MLISKEKFSEMVQNVIDNLPDKFKARMNNVAIFVEDFPNEQQMKKLRLRSKYSLFGLFEGYAQARRLNFGPVLPDRITIFRQPIMEACENEAQCQAQIADTVKHEIAHHFGSGEAGAKKAGKRKV